MAGNQLGKTWAGGYETAMHATGIYPDWWKGIRFEKPVKIWVGGETSELIRDTTQRILFGETRQEWGTGTVPYNNIDKIYTKRGVNDAVDYAIINHANGGNSKIQFKTYDQGRSKWQGETLDFVWFDEEPPYNIYTEGLTRTNRGYIGQCAFMTFTPLKGMSNTVNRFLSEEEDIRGASVHVTRMGIKDAEHYTEEEKKAIIASYPEHERDARANGVPILGSGRVFSCAESDITVSPFDIPPSWALIGGMDFGGASGVSHPAALSKLAIDRDNEIVYVTNVWRRRNITIADKAQAARGFGEIPFAWPHDGLQHDRKSGNTYANELRNEGVNMLEEHATFAPTYDGKSGGNSLEGGVMLMDKMMHDGKFKVFSHCEEFFDEYRMYHRKDGKIVKEFDDVICAVRYAIMMIRFAAVPKNQYQHIKLDPFADNSAWIV